MDTLEASDLAKNKVETRLDVTKNLLKERINIHFISKVTGFSLSELHKIKKGMGM